MPIKKAEGKQYDVIVLGAGLSGLSAAYTLKKLGVDDILVLEAKNRIGGRVYTKEFVTPDGPLSVELGAEWIGENQRTIIAICRALGLVLVPHKAGHDIYINGRYIKAGKPVFNKRWQRRTSYMLGQINHSYSPAEKRELDKVSFDDFLARSGVSDFDRQVLELREGTVTGCSLKDMSAYAVLYHHLSLQNDKIDCDDFYIVGGNSQLPEKLAQAVGWGRIQNNTEVVSIAQDKSGVTIKDAKGVIYSAKHLICTLPIKPLLNINWKHAAIPPEKTQAWQEMKYASITKTSFIFSHRFWSKKRMGVYSSTDACQVYHATDHQRLKSWGALNSYVFGKYQDEFLALNPEEQLLASLDALKLSHSNASYKMAVLQKIWDQDRFAGGAYSYFQPGQWFGIRPVLRQPAGHIHFAGEYLADDAGYMNGAMESGIDAARKIVHGV